MRVEYVSTFFIPWNCSKQAKSSGSIDVELFIDTPVRAYMKLIVAVLGLLLSFSALAKNGFDLSDSLLPAREIRSGGPSREAFLIYKLVKALMPIIKRLADSILKFLIFKVYNLIGCY